LIGWVSTQKAPYRLISAISLNSEALDHQMQKNAITGFEKAQQYNTY